MLSSISSIGGKAATAAAATAGIASVSWYTSTRSQSEALEITSEVPFQIEVHLMDKIQQKSYLQDAKTNVPTTLRIVAVDLPEMRTNAFSGVCRLSHDKIFADGIAPPKSIILEQDATTNSQDETMKKSKSQQHQKKQTLKISQKSLVKVRYLSMKKLQTDRSLADFSLHSFRVVLTMIQFCIAVFGELSKRRVATTGRCRVIGSLG